MSDLLLLHPYKHLTTQLWTHLLTTCVCVLCLCIVFITELTNNMDLQALSGKTLSVTSDPSSLSPAPDTNALLCPYVNLLLCNAQPNGEKRSNIIHTWSWRASSVRNSPSAPPPFNTPPISSRVPDRRCGHAPAGEPSGPERTRILNPAFWGWQGLWTPQQTAQTLPGPGAHPGYDENMEDIMLTL